MALTGYLKLEGNTQGAIDGDCTQKGREKLILVYEVDHAIEIPRDINTGLPTGQRVHKPLTVTVPLGLQTPQVNQACTSGETMKTCVLDFYHINDKGQESLYYEVKLENAIIVSTRMLKLDVNTAETKAIPDLQEISFTYEAITWTHKEGNKEAQDSWKEPKAG